MTHSFESENTFWTFEKEIKTGEGVLKTRLEEGYFIAGFEKNEPVKEGAFFFQCSVRCSKDILPKNLNSISEKIAQQIQSGKIKNHRELTLACRREVGLKSINLR